MQSIKGKFMLQVDCVKGPPCIYMTSQFPLPRVLYISFSLTLNLAICFPSASGVLAKVIKQSRDWCDPLVGHPPTKWRVTALIHCQGTCLGCRFGPSPGLWERQPIDISHSYQCFFPSLPSSLALSLKIHIFLNYQAEVWKALSSWSWQCFLPVVNVIRSYPG